MPFPSRVNSRRGDICKLMPLPDSFCQSSNLRFSIVWREAPHFGKQTDLSLSLTSRAALARYLRSVFSPVKWGRMTPGRWWENPARHLRDSARPVSTNAGCSRSPVTSECSPCRGEPQAKPPGGLSRGIISRYDWGQDPNPERGGTQRPSE